MPAEDASGQVVAASMVDRGTPDAAKADAGAARVNLYVSGVAAWKGRVASTRAAQEKMKLAASASSKLNEVVNTNTEAASTAVAQYGSMVVEVEAERRRISRALIGTLALLFLVVYSLPLVILAPAVAAAPYLAIPSADFDDFLKMFAVTSTSCLVGLYPFLLSSRSQRSRLRFPVFTLFTTLASAMAGVMLWDTHRVIAFGLVEASIAMTVGLLLRANLGSLGKRFNADLEARFPDIILLRELTAVWHDLQNPTSWLNMDKRAAFGVRLQQLEKLVSRNFWRILAPSSGHRKVWAMERGEEIAKRLRDLDKKVSWPGDGARLDVADEIRRICSCIVEAKLADLNTDVGVEPLQPLPGKAMLSHGFLAVLPIAGLMVCKRAGIPLPEKIEPWVALGAYLWAILVLVGVFQPHVEKHLPNLRAALQLFKGKAE